MTTQRTPESFSTGEARCSYHPDVLTRLRCSRCGKPICPMCGVRTPVGMRCPECAGVRSLPTIPTARGVLAKASAAGLALATAIGVVLGYFPSWHFYLTLILGFVVADTMARIAGGKRGLDLQIAGWLVVTTGLVISRVVIAWRLGLTWDEVNQFPEYVQDLLYLRLIPDGLFALLPYLIVYLRFR